MTQSSKDNPPTLQEELYKLIKTIVDVIRTKNICNSDSKIKIEFKKKLHTLEDLYYIAYFKYIVDLLFNPERLTHEDDIKSFDQIKIKFENFTTIFLQRGKIYNFSYTKSQLLSDLWAVYSERNALYLTVTCIEPKKLLECAKVLNEYCAIKKKKQEFAIIKFPRIRNLPQEEEIIEAFKLLHEGNLTITNLALIINPWRIDNNSIYSSSVKNTEKKTANTVTAMLDCLNKNCHPITALMISFSLLSYDQQEEYHPIINAVGDYLKTLNTKSMTVCFRYYVRSRNNCGDGCGEQCPGCILLNTLFGLLLIMVCFLLIVFLLIIMMH